MLFEKPGYTRSSFEQSHHAHSLLKFRSLNLSFLSSTQYLFSSSPFSELFSQSVETVVSHSQVIPNWPASGQ